MICEHTEKIDIRKLARLAPEIPEVLHFEGERIVSTWTKTNFGGRRQWFLCPSCDRRCAIIYRRQRSTLWCCRVCGGGRYLSEHQSPNDRKLHKAFKIRERLGQKKGGVIAPFPGKPKFMHWRAYAAIRMMSEQLEAEIWQKAAAEIQRLLSY